MSQIAAIWSRDKGRCWICGRSVTLADATRDHVRPFSEGGYNKARNYRLAHGLCNSARGALPESEVARIAAENMPCSSDVLRQALRRASTLYYASEDHAARLGDAKRPEVRKRIAKADRKAHRAAVRAGKFKT